MTELVFKTDLGGTRGKMTEMVSLNCDIPQALPAVYIKITHYW